MSATTEQKHTPGPWHVVDRNWEISTVFSSSGDEIARCLIATEADDDVDRKFELIKEANARLIASAPELLTACLYAIRAGDLHGLELKPVRAAITKATGATHD